MRPHLYIPCRGDDDCEEHAVKGDAERTDSAQRKRVSCHDAEGCAECPCRSGKQNRTIGIERIQAAGAGNRDAEQLVRYIISDNQSVEKRCAGRKALRERTAHQQIPRICDQSNKRYLEKRRIGGD